MVSIVVNKEKFSYYLYIDLCTNAFLFKFFLVFLSLDLKELRSEVIYEYF